MKKLNRRQKRNRKILKVFTIISIYTTYILFIELLADKLNGTNTVDIKTYICLIFSIFSIINMKICEYLKLEI